jgi:peptide-methionine (R)-S-oxide reductase
MFETEVGQDSSSVDVRRRAFLGVSITAIVGAVLWSLRKPRLIAAAMPKGDPSEVTIVQFSDSGKMLQKVHVAKVVKSEEEWRQQLPSGVFDITRHADTEFAFSGKYWNLHDTGLYRCICCDNALFSSETKFESGTGWPSFWQPIAPENVRNINDTSFGVTRTAVACTLCDSHLGHVFDDGPDPTGLRYCMNSASLKFVKQE